MPSKGRGITNDVDISYPVSSDAPDNRNSDQTNATILATYVKASEGTLLSKHKSLDHTILTMFHIQLQYLHLSSGMPDI